MAFNTDEYKQLNEFDLTSEEKQTLMSKIKSIVLRYGLANEKWTEAISSQNFLVELALLLDMTREKPFVELINAFLRSFSAQYQGGFKVDDKNILIIPDENEKLINCMIEEDEVDSYYATGDLAAAKILNKDKIYTNYLYGVMVNISVSAYNQFLMAICNSCINELLNDSSLDDRGGWVHYRLPWITARILLGIHNVLGNSRVQIDNDLYNKIKQQDDKALKSLIDRIYNNTYWRSGAGDWVSKWESTGLCIEAFITSSDWNENSYYFAGINKVVNYLFQDDVINQWLPVEVNFDTEESTNDILAKIVLCSVLYRLLKYDKWNRYSHYKKSIGEIFVKCIEILNNTTKINSRQYCTMPQILLYIAKAIKD